MSRSLDREKKKTWAFFQFFFVSFPVCKVVLISTNI